MSHTNPNFILPVGTRIVTREPIRNSADDVIFAPGTVGVVIQSPRDNSHAYRVRFMDETQESLKRDAFTVYAEHKRPDTDRSLPDDELYQYVIYRCVVGSKAYGLSHDDSDTDIRGFYLPPAHLHWSLYGVPEQLEDPQTDRVFWEIQKFIMLALKANPNILECLYTPLVLDASPLAQRLIDGREMFMCRLIYQTYNGYVLSQFRRLKRHRENHGHIRWKHAMHLIRLLIAGTTALQTGEIPVEVPAQYRERLLAIRDGQMSWKDVNAWRKALHDELDTAFAETSLPDRPDYERANQFLIDARRSAIS